jgi:hypothetical protein
MTHPINIYNNFDLKFLDGSLFRATGRGGGIVLMIFLPNVQDQ